MEELLKKIKEERNKLISERAMRELEVNNFFDRLKKVDPSLLEHIDHYNIQEARCKDVFPSLYLEEFDKVASDMYDIEHAKFLSFVEAISEVREKLIKEAEVALGGETVK